MMLERVRSAIGAELISLGVSDSSDFRETMLIRNGLFCGRKFQCQGFQVVWFMEENEIKFFSPDGTMLLATTPERCIESQQAQPTVHPFVPQTSEVQPATRRAA